MDSILTQYRPFISIAQAGLLNGIQRATHNHCPAWSASFNKPFTTTAAMKKLKRAVAGQKLLAARPSFNKISPGHSRRQSVQFAWTVAVMEGMKYVR
jgi:hypothetical protein